MALNKTKFSIIGCGAVVNKHIIYSIRLKSQFSDCLNGHKFIFVEFFSPKTEIAL